MTDAERAAIAATCPHTDCEHENTYTCSGWVYATDALGGVPDGWAKIDGRWVLVEEVDGRILPTGSLIGGMADYRGYEGARKLYTVRAGLTGGKVNDEHS